MLSFEIQSKRPSTSVRGRNVEYLECLVEGLGISCICNFIHQTFQVVEAMAASTCFALNLKFFCTACKRFASVFMVVVVHLRGETARQVLTPATIRQHSDVGYFKVMEA